MAKLEILNKKKVKEIINQIKTQWGCDFSPDFVYLRNPKGKIYIINRDIEKIDTAQLKIDSVGMYFANLKDEKIRLSIEGSQLVGPKANKNIVELNEKQKEEWLRGEDIEKQTNCSGFVIIKHKNDYMGCGKIKEERILNFYPKTRRIIHQT